MKQEQILTKKQQKSNSIKTKKIGLCEWCFNPTIEKKLIKCSNPKCKRKICKLCQTMIDNKPFCNDCIVDFVRYKSLFIVTRGNKK